jgi:DNA (cytosine-5)-methyltransferase 1
MEQLRVTKELRDADRKRGRADDAVRPRYFCWENVPGAFSSGEPHGEDFRIVLEEICRVKDGSLAVPRPDSGAWESAGAIVLGDEFSLAWRVYDAQYWPGTPQRRRRIYLVADFAGLTAPEILFKQDSLLGDTAESRGEGQEPAAGAGSGAESTGGANGCAVAFAQNQRDEVRDLNDVAWALQAEPGMKQQTFVAEPLAFHINQREETIDLGGVSGAIMATRNMQMQTFIANCLNPWDTQHERVFTPEGVAPTMAGADGGGGRNPAGLVMTSGVVTKGNGGCFRTPEVHTALTEGGRQAGQGYPCVLTAGFSPKPSAKAQGVGYEEEKSPTITTNTPAVLCLNDQGGRRMDVFEELTGTLRARMGGHQPLICLSDQGGAQMSVTEEVAGTLRAQEHGHQPLVFENHGIDSRYTGPHDVSPTIAARAGMGGNNLPLVAQAAEPEEAESYCIAGNIIDREVQNGGNGFGYQPDIAYTLNTVDRHAIYNRNRSDEFRENNVAATQAARQSKDATDLVVDTYQETVGTLCRDDHKGINNQYVSDDKCVARGAKLIRRLTPLECERLQGYPDGWTDIPGASDSARYKALGNSVAIPCVTHVMRGVAFFLRKFEERSE